MDKAGGTASHTAGHQTTTDCIATAYSIKALQPERDTNRQNDIQRANERNEDEDASQREDDPTPCAGAEFALSPSREQCREQPNSPGYGRWSSLVTWAFGLGPLA